MSRSDRQKDEIEKTVETVISLIGVISPKTKAQIRAELRTHFEDAAEGARSVPVDPRKRQRLLIERFGDPQRVAAYFRAAYFHERMFFATLRFVLTVALLALTSGGVIFLLHKLVGLIFGDATLSTIEVVRIQWASFFTFFLGLFYALSYELAKKFRSHRKLKSHLVVGLVFLVLGAVLDLLVHRSRLHGLTANHGDLRSLQLFLENAAAALVYFKIYFIVVATSAATMDLLFKGQLEFSKQTILFLACGLPAGLVLNFLNRVSLGEGLQLSGFTDLFVWVAIIATICIFGSFTRFFVPFFERKYIHLLSV